MASRLNKGKKDFGKFLHQCRVKMQTFGNQHKIYPLKLPFNH